MTLGTTLYSVWHAVNGKQSVAAAHLQATAYATDLLLGVALFWPSRRQAPPPQTPSL